MNERLQRRRDRLINGAWLLFLCAGVYGVCKYLLPLFLPFIIGFFIAYLCKPLSVFLHRHLHWPLKCCGTVVIFAVYIALLLLLFLLGGKVIFLIQSLALHAQEYYAAYLAPIVERLSQSAARHVEAAVPAWAPQLDDFIRAAVDGLQNTIATLSGKILSAIASFGMQIPRFLMGLLFAVMASIFISMDYQKISECILHLFPKRYRGIYLQIRQSLKDTAGKYLRAYLILMVITFFELSIGLFIIGVPHPIVVSAATAFCDALPVLGTGVVLLPWAFIELIIGRFSIGIGILILYVVVGMIRNFLEPRILGKQLGLHPLAALLAVYIGYRLFGVIGMVFCPALLQIAVQLKREGLFLDH